MKKHSTTKRGFTLAEIMVVLFIMTIILAAFAPLMTVRAKSTSRTSPWHWATPDSANTYFGVHPNQRVMIGQKTKGDDIDNKLTINTGDGQAYLLFKNAGIARGQFKMLGSSMFFNSPGGAANFLSGSTSYGNAAYGPSALHNIASGYENTALGNGALLDLSSGNTNTAIGAGSQRHAIGSNNTSIGYYSLANSQGQDNIAIGTQALGLNTTGSGNVALGRSALYTSTTGSYNTMLGHRSCNALSATVSNTTCLGAYAGPSANSTASNTVYLGNAYSTVKVLGYLEAASSNISSDIRLKNIQGDYTSGLEQIKKIKPVKFTFKDDKKKTLRVGVIAQDLQKIFPKAVMKGDDGFLKIRQEDMFYAMINAIKELAHRDDAKDKKIKELEARIEMLEKQLNKSKL